MSDWANNLLIVFVALWVAQSIVMIAWMNNMRNWQIRQDKMFLQLFEIETQRCERELSRLGIPSK